MDESNEDYIPPPGPPPGFVKSHAAELALQLQPQGWSILNLGQHPHDIYGNDKTYERYPDVWPALQQLFEASKTFFASPSSDKDKFLTRDGSEEGYSAIRGEKEFITLRRNDAAHCPHVLKDAAEAAWKAVFQVMNEALKGVESELEFPPSSLTRFAEPCLHMDDRARATMLRLFRYENDEAKLVAEPHKDLGLLSLVVGDTPGLEVWDAQAVASNGPLKPFWHPIEQNFEQGMATLMSGRQLEYLTQNRFKPGGHRVVSYGADTPLIPQDLDVLYPSRTRKLLNRLSFNKPKMAVKEKYRYSIVFVLRAHEAVPVDYSSLESPGLVFDAKDKEARTAGELFRRIKAAHYNINIGIKERDVQKQKLQAGKLKGDSETREHPIVGTG